MLKNKEHLLGKLNHMSLQQRDQVKHPVIIKIYLISFRIQKPQMLSKCLDGVITFNRFLLSIKMISYKDIEFTVKEKNPKYCSWRRYN